MALFVITTPEDAIRELLIRGRANLLIDDNPGTLITFVCWGFAVNYLVRGDENTETHLLAERIIRAHGRVIATLEGKELCFGQRLKVIRAHYILSEFE